MTFKREPLYWDLSREEKAAICHTPIGAHFCIARRIHAFDYWRGGDKLDRELADEAFLFRMLSSADLPDMRWHRVKLRLLAFALFLDARLLGRSHWHKAKIKRGWADLAMLRAVLADRQRRAQISAEHGLYL